MQINRVGTEPRAGWAQTWPHLGFVAVYSLWGINMASMKIGGRLWDSFVFNGLRYLLILPFLWGYAYFLHRRGKLDLRMPRRDLMNLLILGAGSAVFMEAMLSFALQYSNAANGAVLGRGLMPILTVVIALFLHEVRLTRRVLIGLPLALCSVLLIVAAGSGEVGFTRETLAGDALLLLRSFLGALYLTGMSRLVRKHPLPLLLAWEMTAGAVVLLPFVLSGVDGALLQGMPREGWLSLLYTAFFATLAGFALHNWSLGRLGPFRSSMYGYLHPLFAALAGIALLGESLAPGQIIGAAGVLTAMYLVQRDRMQAKPAEKGR